MVPVGITQYLGFAGIFADGSFRAALTNRPAGEHLDSRPWRAGRGGGWLSF